MGHSQKQIKELGCGFFLKKSEYSLLYKLHYVVVSVSFVVRGYFIRAAEKCGDKCQ